MKPLSTTDRLVDIVARMGSKDASALAQVGLAGQTAASALGGEEAAEVFGLLATAARDHLADIHAAADSWLANLDKEPERFDGLGCVDVRTRPAPGAVVAADVAN